LDFDFIDQI